MKYVWKIDPGSKVKLKDYDPDYTEEQTDSHAAAQERLTYRRRRQGGACRPPRRQVSPLQQTRSDHGANVRQLPGPTVRPSLGLAQRTGRVLVQALSARVEEEVSFWLAV